MCFLEHTVAKYKNWKLLAAQIFITRKGSAFQTFFACSKIDSEEGALTSLSELLPLSSAVSDALK